MKQLGILVSGGGTNMQSIVEACRDGVLAGLAEPAVIVSNKKAAGALDRAQRLDVPAEVVPHGAYASREEHERALLEVLQARKVDLVVLAGYMRILTPVFLKEAPGHVVNIHPVPTHSYQGPAGYEDIWGRRAELASNFPTVHLVDAGVDTGKVLLYGLPYAVGDAASLEAMRERGLAEEHQLFPEAIHYLLTVPGVAYRDPESSSSALAGVSTMEIDLMRAVADARELRGGRVRCMAQPDWQGMGYRLSVEGEGAEEEARPGWLAGSERVTFTRLLLELLRFSRQVPIDFSYQGLRVDLRDTRQSPGG